MITAIAVITMGLAAATAAAPTPLVAFIADPAGAHPALALSGVDGGGTRLLGPAANARIAPDGSKVIAVRAAGSGAADQAVVLYSTSSARVRKLLHSSGDPYPAAWSADSRYAAIIEFDRLLVADTQSGEVRTITTGQFNAVSFAPAGGDLLVFDRSPLNSTATDLYVAHPDGTAMQALTHDGRSTYPLWGPHSIVFTRESPRAHAGPLFELWSIASNGGHPRQLTHVPARKLDDGLIAIAFSANGSRLLANFEGTDTVEAWAIDLSGPIALPRDLTAKGNGTIGVGLSRNGTEVLAEHGYGGGTPAHWSIETIPWDGGRARQLAAHGAFPSWSY